MGRHRKPNPMYAALRKVHSNQWKNANYTGGTTLQQHTSSKLVTSYAAEPESPTANATGGMAQVVIADPTKVYDMSKPKPQPVRKPVGAMSYARSAQQSAQKPKRNSKPKKKDSKLAQQNGSKPKRNVSKPQPQRQPQPQPKSSQRIVSRTGYSQDFPSLSKPKQKPKPKAQPKPSLPPPKQGGEWMTKAKQKPAPKAWVEKPQERVKPKNQRGSKSRKSPAKSNRGSSNGRSSRSQSNQGAKKPAQKLVQRNLGAPQQQYEQHNPSPQHQPQHQPQPHTQPQPSHHRPQPRKTSEPTRQETVVFVREMASKGSTIARDILALEKENKIYERNLEKMRQDMAAISRRKEQYKRVQFEWDKYSEEKREASECAFLLRLKTSKFEKYLLCKGCGSAKKAFALDCGHILCLKCSLVGRHTCVLCNRRSGKPVKLYF